MYSAIRPSPQPRSRARLARSEAAAHRAAPQPAPCRRSRAGPCPRRTAAGRTRSRPGCAAARRRSGCRSRARGTRRCRAWHVPPIKASYFRPTQTRTTGRILSRLRNPNELVGPRRFVVTLPRRVIRTDEWSQTCRKPDSFARRFRLSCGWRWSAPNCGLRMSSSTPARSSRRWRAAASRGARLALFPELCITAYSCGDLFFQPLLLARGACGAGDLAEAAAERAEIAAVVGLPLAVEGKLYNVAACWRRGESSGSCRRAFCRARASSTRSGGSRRPPRPEPLARPDRPDRRRRGAVWPGSALRRGRTCAGLRHRHRDLRGPVGRQPAERRHGPGGRDGAAERLGQQRAARQGRVPSRPGEAAVGALAGRLSVRGRGAGRVDHRPGVGRATR